MSLAAILIALVIAFLAFRFITGAIKIVVILAILGAVGASGYQLGKCLKERDRAADARPG